VALAAIGLHCRLTESDKLQLVVGIREHISEINLHAKAYRIQIGNCNRQLPYVGVAMKIRFLAQPVMLPDLLITF
jgi:hypothetical protein